MPVDEGIHFVCSMTHADPDQVALACLALLFGYQPIKDVDEGNHYVYSMTHYDHDQVAAACLALLFGYQQ